MGAMSEPVTCAICGAAETVDGNRTFDCNFVCPHSAGNPAFEFAQRSSKKIMETLIEENSRLWERIKELQQPVTFDFYAGGFKFRGTVNGPEHIEIVRIGPTK